MMPKAERYKAYANVCDCPCDCGHGIVEAGKFRAHADEMDAFLRELDGMIQAGQSVESTAVGTLTAMQGKIRGKLAELEK